MSNTVTLKKIAEEIDLLLSQNNKDKALEKIDYLTEKNLSAGLAYKGVFAYKNNDYDAAETYLLQSYAANPNQL
ncbi:MAG: hypothetical protein FJY58_10040, partial [Betaproteobacteria bacterium]|nr:hypothetical protein [Betaproteobacteria bacterium]